ncbi:unnamed protein product, partial [Ectocarpus sp. 6 AP-2014]
QLKEQPHNNNNTQLFRAHSSSEHRSNDWEGHANRSVGVSRSGEGKNSTDFSTSSVRAFVMSGEEVAKAFLTHFYSKFANNGAQLDQLGALYQPTSMLTIEGNQVVGATNIVAKYKDLGGNLQFQPDTLDVQMGTTTSALLAVVTGKLKIDNGNQLHYLQMFQLVSTGPGAYYVHNDILRLIYS